MDICPGPLTNLALTVKLDPELPSRIRRLVIMGGANGPGNMSPHAVRHRHTSTCTGDCWCWVRGTYFADTLPMPSQEFNFYCDPEAAKVVMAKFSNVVLVPMDVGATHPLPWPRLEGILAKPSLLAAFLAGVKQGAFGTLLHMLERCTRLHLVGPAHQNTHCASPLSHHTCTQHAVPGYCVGITASSAQAAKATGTSGFVTLDPHAALVAVCPSAIQASLPVFCDVELQVLRAHALQSW